MALEFDNGTETGTPRGRHYTIPERLFKTADGKIVPEADPEANSLFKPAGAKILMTEAIELGLVTEEEPVKDKSTGTKKAGTAENKQRKTPPKNKVKGGK